MSDELTGRALDEAIARLLFGETCRMMGDQFDADGFHVPPHYSTDPAAARTVEEAILQRDCFVPYLAELLVIVGGDWRNPLTEKSVTAAWFASPEQRCRATLAALESAQGDEEATASPEAVAIWQKQRERWPHPRDVKDDEECD